MMYWAVVALLLCAAILPLQALQSMEALPETVSLAAEANRLFTIKLLKQLGKNRNNFLFSPFSISSTMALASLGTRGNTRREIDRAMHFDLVNRANTSAIHYAYKYLLQKLYSDHVGVIVSTASAFFRQREIEIITEFRKQAQKFYNTDFNTMNDNPEAQINQWTAEHTNNMMKELLYPGSITPDVSMVLISTVYFKGTWRHRFDKDYTRLMTFHVKTRKTVKVPMMFEAEFFQLGFNRDLHSNILEMPYEGEDFSMYVFLPVKKMGLTRLITSLTAEKLMTSLKNLTNVWVHFWLPKVKLDQQIHLSKSLKKLGIQRLFSNPDLSGLTSNAAAVHNIRPGAVIDVGEEDTEVAVATGKFFLMSRPPKFIVDHPYLFFIIHKPTDMILFVGGVFKP